MAGETKLTLIVDDNGTVRTVLGGAASALKEVQREADTTATRTTSAMESLTSSVGKVVAAVGGIAVAYKAAGAVIDQINLADNLNDLSKRTGIATETLSAYKLAAEASGTSLEGLATGFKFLSKNIADGNDALAGVLRTSGDALKMRDLRGVVSDLAGVFEQLPDGPTKARLAIELFGRAGTELIPFLNEGRTGLENWAAAAERAGVVISGNTARAADQFNDSLVVLRANVSGLAMTAAESLLPTLNQLAESTTVWANANNALVSSSVETWARGAASAIESLTPAVREAVYWYSELTNAVAQSAAGIDGGSLLTPAAQSRAAGLRPELADMSAANNAGARGIYSYNYSGFVGPMPQRGGSPSSSYEAQVRGVLGSGDSNTLSAVKADSAALHDNLVAASDAAMGTSLGVGEIDKRLQASTSSARTFTDTFAQGLTSTFDALLSANGKVNPIDLFVQNARRSFASLFADQLPTLINSSFDAINSSATTFAQTISGTLRNSPIGDISPFITAGGSSQVSVDVNGMPVGISYGDGYGMSFDGSGGMSLPDGTVGIGQSNGSISTPMRQTPTTQFNGQAALGFVGALAPVLPGLFGASQNVSNGALIGGSLGGAAFGPWGAVAGALLGWAGGQIADASVGKNRTADNDFAIFANVMRASGTPIPYGLSNDFDTIGNSPGIPLNGAIGRLPAVYQRIAELTGKRNPNSSATIGLGYYAGRQIAGDVTDAERAAIAAFLPTYVRYATNPDLSAIPGSTTEKEMYRFKEEDAALLLRLGLGGVGLSSPDQLMYAARQIRDKNGVTLMGSLDSLNTELTELFQPANHGSPGQPGHYTSVIRDYSSADRAKIAADRLKGIGTLFGDQLPNGIDIMSLGMKSLIDTGQSVIIDMAKFTKSIEQMQPIAEQLQSTLTGGLSSGISGAIGGVIAGGNLSTAGIRSAINGSIVQGATGQLTSQLVNSITDSSIFKDRNASLFTALQSGDASAISTAIANFGDVTDLVSTQLEALVPAIKAVRAAYEESAAKADEYYASAKGIKDAKDSYNFNLMTGRGKVTAAKSAATAFETAYEKAMADGVIDADEYAKLSPLSSKALNMLGAAQGGVTAGSSIAREITRLTNSIYDMTLEFTQTAGDTIVYKEVQSGKLKVNELIVGKVSGLDGASLSGSAPSGTPKSAKSFISGETGYVRAQKMSRARA